MSNSWIVRFPLLALAGLAACSAPATAPVPAGIAARAGAETITAGDMYAHVAFLSSDELRGRDTPSPGLEIAASYIVSEYRRLGLEPAGENGTYYQRYPFPEVALDTTTVHFGTLVGNDNQMLEYGRDFYVSGLIGSGPAGGADMNHGRLVFVGELGAGGLPAGDYDGAVPLVVIPGDYTRDWRLAAARARRAAEEAGATAIVVATAPEFPQARFEQLAAQARLPRRIVPGGSDVAVFYVTASAAQRLVARAGVTLASLARAGTPSVLPGVDAHFAARLLPTTQELGAPNVVAVLPGSDPALRDEYLILSAHMDHVGVGRPVNGDSIYNGADDNASGTAGLLEVAEAMASLPEHPRRSVVFLHVSGEEHGLLGSRWYSDHPTVPLEQVVANINVDMIGRNAPDSVVVIGKEYSSLGDEVNRVGAAHPELGLVVSDDVWPEERFFFRSDHFNFARRGIPALFFFTGVHEDYHQPSDEVERLDVDKAARVARLIFHTAQAIADAPQRPVWDPAGLEEVRALMR